MGGGVVACDDILLQQIIARAGHGGKEGGREGGGLALLDLCSHAPLFDSLSRQ